MTATMTIYSRTGEARTMPTVQADNMIRASRGEWSAAPPLPKGWDREVPRYRASMDLRPPQYARHRLEPPFTSTTDTHMWQYAERPIKAAEQVETTAWPHPSMIPLNETARQILEFFRTRQKSRLPQSPWRAGRLFLDDGLTGAVPDERTLYRRPEPAVPSPIRIAGR